MSIFHSNPTHERRVRQIYDSLDSGNPKKAIQEADKLLKKQKDALDAKALKALAYIRLCKFKECADILAELEKDQPTDDSTLHALSLCFRELNKPEDLARVFENATKKCPHVEELWTNLYFAYMRTENYQNQHKTALTLYKGCQKQMYLNWAVMSLVFQALRNPDKAKVIYLPLAEKMMTKSTPSDKSLSETEMDLLSIILEMSGKWEDAMKLFQSPAGSKIRYGDVPAKEKLAQIYHKMENYDVASHCYQELIKEQPDNWNLYQKYLDTLLHIPDTDTFKDYLGSFKHKKSLIQRHRSLHKYNRHSGSTNDPASHLANGEADLPNYVPGFDVLRHISLALDFVEGIVSWLESHGKKGHRGPYMAKFDIYLRLLVIGLKIPPNLETLGALVEKYIKIFGSKPCCFSDLEYFTRVPQFKEALDLKELFTSHMPGLAEAKAQQEEPTMTTDAYNSMKKRDGVVFTIFKLGKYMGYLDRPAMSRARVFSVASGFVSCYFTRDSVTLVTQPAAATAAAGDKVGPAALNDPHNTNSVLSQGKSPRIPSSDHHTFYATMASQLLFDLWSETGSFDYLRQALVLLEHTINRYPDCVQIRFALIKIYFLIGAPALCIEHFHKIDVKFVQYDTLGNFLMYPLFAFSHFGPLKTCFENIIKFYENSYKNIWDYCVTVVKVNFFQIYDFMDFKHHLTDSILRNFITIESVLLDLLTEATSVEIAEEIIDSIPLKTLQDFNQDELCDNTDYYVIESYDSNQRLDYDDFIDENYQQEKYWVGVRNRILHTLSIAVLLGAKPHYSPLAKLPRPQQPGPAGSGSGHPSEPEESSPCAALNYEYYEKERLLTSLRSTYHSMLVQKEKWSSQFHPDTKEPGRCCGLVTGSYKLYGPFTSQLPIYLVGDGIYLEILLNAIRLILITNYSLSPNLPGSQHFSASPNGHKSYCDDIKTQIQTILKILKEIEIPAHNVTNNEICHGFPTYSPNQPCDSQGKESFPEDPNHLKKIRDQNFVIAAASKMYHMRFACETLGLLTLYVGSLHQLLKPLKQHANKKGKKKVAANTPSSLSNGPVPALTKTCESLSSRDSGQMLDNSDKINDIYECVQNLLIFLRQTGKVEMTSLMDRLLAGLATHITQQSTSLTAEAHSPSLLLEKDLSDLRLDDNSADAKDSSHYYGSVFTEENFASLDLPKDLFTKISSSYQKTFTELTKMLATGGQYINSLKLT